MSFGLLASDTFFRSASSQIICDQRWFDMERFGQNLEKLHHNALLITERQGTNYLSLNVLPHADLWGLTPVLPVLPPGR